MPGKFHPINPKGTYLRTNEDPRATIATSLSLRTLRVTAGDYIALQGSGSFIYKTGEPPITNLNGCFFNGNQPIASGASGQEQAVRSPPTALGNLKTDIPQDFTIPFTEKVIVRVPSGATEIKFTPNDGWFSDNVSNQYGVLVSLPNKPRPTLDLLADTSVDVSLPNNDYDLTPADEEHLAAAAQALPKLTDYPTATTFARSPFSMGENPPQWRGWYKNSGWKPGNSHYNPAENGGFRKHGGWDIFAPSGSQLVAAVGPSRFDWISGVSGFGNVAVMRFVRARQIYSLIYAHAASMVGVARQVVAGEPIARAGCTGNADKENCGIELSTGGFTDHVHVGLYKGIKIEPPSEIDPATLLTWAMITPQA